MNKPTFKLAGLLILFVSSLLGQERMTFGIKGGLPLTGSVVKNPGNFTVESARKYIIGASFELDLRWGLSVEADALFHPYTLKVFANNPPTFTANTLNDFKIVEIPLFAKYRITNGRIRPFIEGGVAGRVFSDQLDVSHLGVVVGGGLEFRVLPRVRVSPEFRYTRWGPDTIYGTAGSGDQKNQAALLLGISF
jgi:opacity protein-like surface antigen